MGFSTIIDILGSSLIGGLLLMILLRLNDAAVENSFINGGEYIVQLNLVEIVQLIEHDFRKIGYCADWKQIPDPSQAILVADSNGISFLTDIGSASSTMGDKTVDTLRYYVGPTSELTMTSNPDDRMLYRVINSRTPVGANLGLTEFKLTYYDVFGDSIGYPIRNTGEINTIQIDIKVESTEGFISYADESDTLYSTSFWRQIRLAARNLRNR
jgi:hypothetical protein